MKNTQDKCKQIIKQTSEESPTCHYEKKQINITPNKATLSISKETESPILIKKNSQMNGLGTEVLTFLISLPRRVWQLKLWSSTEKRICIHMEATLPEAQGVHKDKKCFWRGQPAHQLSTQMRPSLPFPKARYSWEEGCSMWRGHITEIKKCSTTREGCRLPGRLSGRQWDIGVCTQTLRAISIRQSWIFRAQNGNSHGSGT